MAPLCCFGCNLVRVQQEVEWQLRVALMQSHADYQQATGTEDDPSAWMDAFPPQHLAGLSHRQQIILDQSLQALRRSSEQVADLSAAGWHKVCDLAGRAWDTLRTKWGQVLHQLSTRVSSTVEAAAAAALTAPTKAVNALQPYGLSIALDPKPQPQQQQQQQSDSMHRLAFHDLAWSSSRSQLWQQVSVEQPLGAAKQQSQQQWHQGMAAAAAASGSSPAATRKALAHIDATMAGLLADVTAVLQAPIARTTQSQSVTAPAPVAVRALPAGPQCQPPSLSDMLRCSSLPSAPAAVDCFWTPVATWTGHTVETVSCWVARVVREVQETPAPRLALAATQAVCALHSVLVLPC